MIEDRKQFGQALRKARTAAGLTLRGLAEHSGVRFSNISAIESGRVIAGLRQAIRLADGLRLRGQDRESFLLAASLSSRRSNPDPIGSSPLALFYRSLPWLLQRLGLKELDRNPTVNFCKISELPAEHPPLVVVFEHPRLDKYLDSSRILAPAARAYIRDNPGKHFVALIVREDSSQTLIEGAFKVFA